MQGGAEVLKILIKNGRIINPADGTDKVSDMLVENGIVKEISQNINTSADKIIDANKMWVTPGFIDLHVHLREPGFEHKETIATGSRAAAAGGYTTVCCMPNTKPVADSIEVVEYIKKEAEKNGVVNVLPIGAITKGQEGKELADIEGMYKAGICAISEDGKSVMNAQLLKEAMIKAKKLNIPVLSHCEDRSLVKGGCMNEGAHCDSLGLKGISNDSEDVIVARDIVLAESTGAKLHLCHMSTKGSVALLSEAKKRGVNVTGEITPHHFTLSDENVDGKDTNTKMNPPLRSKDDVETMRKALKDGVADTISTDHAPHSEEEKAKDYQSAPFGIVGSETAFALSNSVLVEEGYLTPSALVEKMSYNPSKILGIDKGDISVGKVADITITNPEKVFKIDKNKFYSKGKNTPFDGYEVKGSVEYTIVGGRIVFEKGKINDN